MTGADKYSWRKSGDLFLFVACTLALSLPSVGQQARKPLTESEIAHLLRNHVSADSIVDIANQYQLAFEITPQATRELKAAGATEQLISRLKEYQLLKPTAPTPAPTSGSPTVSAPPSVNAPVLLISSATGDSEVYVDDVREGKTSSDGLLKIVSLQPGPHKVRVSRSGFADFQTTSELKSGETTTQVIPVLVASADVGLSPKTTSQSQAIDMSATTTGRPVASSALPSNPVTKAPTPGATAANISKAHPGYLPKSSLTTYTGEPVAIKDAFHIVGIPAMKRNKKFDLEVTTRDMIFSEGGKRVYRIPFERMERVQMNPTKREYAKATYAAVLVLGAPGAAVLAIKKDVDALIINYRNEKGGLMEMVIQVPHGMGTPCLDRLARGGVPIGPPDETEG
jgi:hypothetical protein